jgi:hypothetical protein
LGVLLTCIPRPGSTLISRSRNPPHGRVPHVVVATSDSTCPRSLVVLPLYKTRLQDGRDRQDESNGQGSHAAIFEVKGGSSSPTTKKLLRLPLDDGSPTFPCI